MIYDKLVEILEDFLSIQAQDLSQDLYELVVILEEEFNVEIPSDRLSSEIDTIEDLVRILKELGVED